MLPNADLRYHYHPQKGWMNDPNGLCEFKGEYHFFYQHSSNFEYPWQEPMEWGHCRTRDFLNYEELPNALSSDKDYDKGGVWSGTAVEKDGMLYLFYASVDTAGKQTISVAYSKDGINFEKYENNPIIRDYPADGSRDFRDPAILVCEYGMFLVVASADVKRVREICCFIVATTFSIGIMSVCCMNMRIESIASARPLCRTAMDIFFRHR